MLYGELKKFKKKYYSQTMKQFIYKAYNCLAQYLYELTRKQIKQFTSQSILYLVKKVEKTNTKN